MYQNIYYNKHKSEMHVWDDDLGYYITPYHKYAYKKSDSGIYKSIDNNNLEKVFEWSQSDIDSGNIYESDINSEMRFLIDTYHSNDAISKNHAILFIDIETGVEGGYASPDNPWQPITSIALYNSADKKKYIILTNNTNQEISNNNDDIILIITKTEKELITEFFKIYKTINPTIITGWNINYFDIPYLYNRVYNYISKKAASYLSPINIINSDNKKERYYIAGVSCMDYMQLYKTFTQNEEQSYALNSISKKELGKGKIEYDGDLNILFKTDINKFIEYNITDVMLVVELDNKLKFLELAMSIAHLSHCVYEDIFLTTRFLTGACLTYLKNNNLISLPHIKHNNNGKSFAGAYVKDPQPGLHEWVFDEDMESLYPSVIRTLNISPETIFGYITNYNITDIQLDDITYNIRIFNNSENTNEFIITGYNNLINILTKYKLSISATGVLYSKEKEGFIPSILNKWSNDRKTYRKLMTDNLKSGNSDLASFYNTRQQTVKRMSNSLYGALGTPGFKFYNIYNAESTTITGQNIIAKAAKLANEWFTERTKIDRDYIIYIDTDSLFISATPLIELIEHQKNIKLDKTQKADITYKTSTIIEQYINSKWDDYCLKTFNVNNHFFNIKQEYIAESGLWLTSKKRYAQKIISEKGVSIFDATGGKMDYKLDIKGLDIIRSDFALVFKNIMYEILLDILNKTDKDIINKKIIKFKNDLISGNINFIDIMNPTGVKNIEKFLDTNKQIFTNIKHGTPIHVRSSINYNNLLTYFKLNNKHQQILSGEKIKWIYLKENNFKMNSIALKGYNDPIEIINFIAPLVDYDKIFNGTLYKKLLGFYEAMGWEFPNTNSTETISNFFQF